MTHNRTLSLTPTAVAAAVLCLPLWAAAQVPDAGSVLRDLRPAAPALPASAAPTLRTVPPAATPVPAGGERVQVQSFRITGNTVIGTDQLLPLLQDSVGQELDLAQLEDRAARISRFYRQRGYTVARAYLPAQQVRDGVVEIAIVEGRYGAITVRNPLAPLPLAALAEGDVVADAPLERSLLLAADVPGITVRSTLQPGTAVGTSELVVEVEPGQRLAGSLEADNFGSRSTGHERLGGSLAISNPTGLGDLVTLRALTSGEGLAYGRAGWQVPVSGHGTRLGVAASLMRYELGEEFEALDAHGTARVATAFASHPLLRSRAANLNVQLAYEAKHLEDRVGSTGAVTDKSVRAVNLGLTGDRTDGSGVWVFSATYTRGDLSIDSAEALSADQASARTAGGFGKFSLTAQRQQSLGAATSLLLAYTGQWSSKNLDSSEKLPLGGAGAVRAYPQGEASSDEASLLTVELRHALGANWQLVGFVDAATGRANAEPFAGAPGTRRSLSGAGVGLNWAGPQGWTARVFYAHRLGHKATAEPDRSGRVWLQASRSF